ncbi:hypothetical protein ACFQBY_00360 [Promicromonospora citrea]|uniref:hypothetical protein n=1 Tax=Promicromonospora citrea TaxID=43677 RepID=UPI00360CB794
MVEPVPHQRGVAVDLETGVRHRQAPGEGEQDPAGPVTVASAGPAPAPARHTAPAGRRSTCQASPVSSARHCSVCPVPWSALADSGRAIAQVSETSIARWWSTSAAATSAATSGARSAASAPSAPCTTASLRTFSSQKRLPSRSSPRR